MIKSEILITMGMVWPVSSGKWKANLRLPFVAEVEFGNVGFEEKNLLEQRRSNNELNPHNFMTYYHADCLD